MTIPKSYEALAADLASEKILSKTLQGQKEAYMMLADQCKVDLDEAVARNSAVERKNANQCESIREYQDIEAALLEELELQKNHFKIQLQGAKDADMLQQRLTVAEHRAADLKKLLCDVINEAPTGFASLKVDLANRVNAELKPAAEPEHICEGCGSKGWTANCDQCVPY